MRLISYSLLIVIACLVGCSNTSNENMPPKCDDFLAMFNHKPKALEFQHCKVEYDRQGKPAVASYRVTGEKASVIEQYLIQHFDMPSLYFVCCGWEPVDKIKKAGYSRYKGEYINPKIM